MWCFLDLHRSCWHPVQIYWVINNNILEWISHQKLKKKPKNPTQPWCVALMQVLKVSCLPTESSFRTCFLKYSHLILLFDLHKPNDQLTSGSGFLWQQISLIRHTNINSDSEKNAIFHNQSLKLIYRLTYLQRIFYRFMQIFVG